MKAPVRFIMCIALLLGPLLGHGEDETFCKSLKNFVRSVKPDQAKSIEFQTSWGSNFKDDPEEAISAKRCFHHDDEQAKSVCEYLVQHGLTEFSSHNFKNALVCLSPKTRIAPLLLFEFAKVHFSYGSNDRGALIDMYFTYNDDIGGMELKIEASGY